MGAVPDPKLQVASSGNRGRERADGRFRISSARYFSMRIRRRGALTIGPDHAVQSRMPRQIGD